VLLLHRRGDGCDGTSKLVPHSKAHPWVNRCKKCGCHLMTNHPPLGLTDVYSATLPTLKYSPAVHVNYAETVLPMKDGLPKFREFPAEFGGSGEQMTG